MLTAPPPHATSPAAVPQPGGSPARQPVSRTAAAVSGALAAGAALAAGELATAATDSGPSLVTAVGTDFIDRYAARLKDLAVALFGTNDKVALVTGIVVVSIGLGAAFGLLARRWWLAAPVGFAAFGAVGALALATDPLGAAEDAIVAGVASVAVGIGAFALLWRLADPASGPAGDRRSAVATRSHPAHADSTSPAGKARMTLVDRRGFLAGTGGVILAAGAGAGLSRRLRASESIEAARRDTVLPAPRSTERGAASAAGHFDVAGISPYITPNDDFYRIDTALMTPQVDAGSWRLRIDGMVDTPFELTYDELLALDSVEETVTLTCVSNEIGGRLVGNAVWQGVPLAALLERAGVQDGATQIVGRSVDSFTAGFPTSAVGDGRTALVAYAMNGEPLPADHGYPARLVVAGLYGYVSATKWLDTIELTTWEDFDGYWVPRGWSKRGPIKTASRIDVPRHQAELAAGLQPIAGIALAPTRGISRVEVQVDDGEWREAELAPVETDESWVQWRVDWDATPGEHTLRVRATDGDGETQTSERANPAPDGATGWHTRTVAVT